MALRVTVVVPTFGRADRLPRLVAALDAQTLAPTEWDAVIVDDCSTDGTGEVLTGLAGAAGFALRTERTPMRCGPAPARNLGWQRSTAPVLAFTDDDCVPDPGWLAAGLAAMEADERVGILQGRTRRADHLAPVAPTIRTVIREVSEPSPWFEGCNLFARRVAVVQAGGFDEAIAWAGEETAMAWTILEHGWHRGWAPEAIVDHDVEERNLLWHLRNHYLEGHAVRIAARHPAIRDTFWRPWAVERRGALVGLALLGLALGRRHRAALLLAAPYLDDLIPGWPRRPHRSELKWALYRTVSDVASFAGKAVEGARARTLVL